MSKNITVKNPDELVQELATYEGKQVIIDFWATWCGPCRLMAPILENIENRNPDVVVLKIDVDQNPEIAAGFSVQSIPTLMFMKNGAINRPTIIGVVGEEDLLAHLK